MAMHIGPLQAIHDALQQNYGIWFLMALRLLLSRVPLPVSCSTEPCDQLLMELEAQVKSCNMHVTFESCTCVIPCM